jgi:hypothetical protein
MTNRIIYLIDIWYDKMKIRYVNDLLKLYTNEVIDMDSHEDDISFVLSWNQEDVCKYDIYDAIPQDYTEIQIPATLPVYRFILNHTKKQYVECPIPAYLDSVSKILRDFKWSRSDDVCFLNTNGGTIYLTKTNIHPYGHTMRLKQCKDLYLQIINYNPNYSYTRVYACSHMIPSDRYSDIIIQPSSL